MPAARLRQLAMILGIACGLIELYLSLTISVKTGRSADYTGIFIYILPVFIMLGGLVVVRFEEAYLGAGIMIAAFAILHVLEQIKGVHLIPMVLLTLAVIAALRVDYEQRWSDAPQ